MNCTKCLIISVIGVGACTGVSLHHARLHARSPEASPHELASYAPAKVFPGNATPEEALQSLGLAADTGDLQLLRDSVTPNIHQMLDRGGPNFASHAMSMATELAAGRILKKETLSDNEVLLHVQPEARDTTWKVRMQKVGSSWKLADLKPSNP